MLCREGVCCVVGRVSQGRRDADDPCVWWSFTEGNRLCVSYCVLLDGNCHLLLPLYEL